MHAGIFGGNNYAPEPVVRAPVVKVPAANRDAAGSAITKGEAVSLTWGENAAPQVQPPLSARSHKANSSSIEGGACRR